jgi:microcystin-dependent protein
MGVLRRAAAAPQPEYGAVLAGGNLLRRRRQIDLDGKSTFALPNLQGSAAMHEGQGQGLSQRFLGEQSGVESITLLTSEIPIHAHNMMARVGAGTTTTPTNAVPASMSWVAGASFGAIQGYSTGAPTTPMNVQTLAPTGGGLPHNNMQPYLTLSFCIALQGVFPPRG